MQDDHIPGVAVSVVQNGQVLLNKGYGFASIDPRRTVDPANTMFRLGDLSAAFTWLAVLKEVERSHMRLDAPINLYLPEKLQVRDQGYAEPVRLRDLMDHASGFEERALGRLYERDPGRVRALEVYLRQERPRRVVAPGLRAEYSDYDAALAGEALTQVTGQPYENLIEAEILRPAGLNRTTFREPRPAIPGLPAPMPSGLAQNLAQGFRWNGVSEQARAFAYAGQIAPAASASSTAADMARYMTLLLGGGSLDGQIFGPATAQAQRAMLMSAAPGLPGWTYGLIRQPLPGGIDGFGLDGSDLSSHAGMITVPALGLGVFVAANSETAGSLVRRLPLLLIQHFFPSASGPPPAQADPKMLGRIYAGHYLSEQRRYGGLEKFVDLLTRQTTVEAQSDGLLVIRAPDDSGVWVQNGQTGRFVDPDRGLASAFEIKNGRAVRWFSPTASQSFVRVGFFEQPAGLAVLTAATLIASVAALIGLFVRDRRDFRQTTIQSRASALQTTAAVLWIVAMLAFTAWGSGALADHAQAFFNWPGVFILMASACALVAALASVGQLLMLPAVWRGGRRLDSWTTGRKVTFTVTVALFVLFSSMLAAWGALEPWNS
jgi:CubicO group peptidase (beta-lactamase class C family)